MKWWKLKARPKAHAAQPGPGGDRQSSEAVQLTGNYATDLAAIQHIIGHQCDVHCREFGLGQTGIRAVIFFVEGLSDKEMIEKYILSSLMQLTPGGQNRQEGASDSAPGQAVTADFIKNEVLPISEIIEVNALNELLLNVLTGSTALIIEGLPQGFLLGTTKGKTRGIEEPVSEALLRGPRVGFSETLSDNTALLRRHGENGSLVMTKFLVGKRARKELVVAYIQDVADPNILEEVQQRIQKIDLDNIPESGYVEQLIEDNFLSPFPQVQSTERPDRVISALMEGRVAILLDGTPFALIVPVTFSMLIQSPEDYYERWLPGSLIRLLRFGAALISLLAPALYISFISFHPGLIPTKLVLSIIESRESVPFPSLIEALILEVSIEILREAGLRLPKPIGPAMGIVGGLIIGEAAVQAGIVSPILVIVVAVTAISSFAIPQYSAGLALRMLRFVGMLFAAVMGLYGVILFFLLLCSHMVKLKSFGIPYASPAIPYRVSDWKDFLVRMPLMTMKRRPKLTHAKDSVRKGEQP